MLDDFDLVLGYKVKISSNGVAILVSEKPTSKEAEYMTDLVCGYLIEEGFFDKAEMIKVEIVRKKE